MAISPTQSATSFGYGQIQRQLALKNAEQLAAKASTLAAQASSARKEADEAIRRAGQLEIESGNANTKATNARQAVAASNSAIKAGENIGKQADRIYQSMQSDDSDNLYGRNGRKSGSSYSAGSIFTISG